MRHRRHWYPSYGADPSTAAADAPVHRRVLGMNPRPLGRLLAFGGAGGVIGALAVGGPLGIIGGLLLGGFTEEAWARIRARSRARASMGWDQHARLDLQYGLPPPPPGPLSPPGEYANYAEQMASLMPPLPPPTPGMPFVPPPPPPPGPGMWRGGRGRDGLAPGQQLGSGQQIASRSGQYVLTMQTDGNLVLHTPQGQVLWSSGTAGSGGVMAIMQTDGNFVVYGPSQNAVWSSGTSGQPGNRLTLRDDGNLTVVTPQRGVAWASNTSSSTIVAAP